MWRALLFGGVLAVSISACGKSDTKTSAKVAPGVAAGKVLEVKGSVTFKRGDETTPLAAGAIVEGADVVITGADGNVVIELAHNSARWELGPNKQTKVSESIAWKAQKATAQEIDQATAAAGRPAERNAAGTIATAGETEGAAAPAPPAEAAMATPPRDEAAKADKPDMIAKGGAAPPPRRRPSAPAKAAPPAPPPPPPADVESDDNAPRRTRGAQKKEAAPMAPPTPGSAETARAAPPAPGGSIGASGTGAGGGGIGATLPAGLVAAKAAQLHKCMVDNSVKEDVSLIVNVVDGKATVKLSSKSAVSAGLEHCVKSVIGGITFAGSAKVTRVLKP